jgi:hypothetical protein
MIEELLSCLERFQSAKRDYEKAKKDCDPARSYFLSAESDEVDRAKKGLTDALYAIIDHRIRLVVHVNSLNEMPVDESE